MSDLWANLISSYDFKNEAIEKKNEYEKTSDKRIKAILRASFTKSPERNEAIKRAWIGRGAYRCNLCKKGFAIGAVDVHHMNPVKNSTDWNEYVQVLYCDVSMLEVLCKPCHKGKHGKS